VVYDIVLPALVVHPQPVIGSHVGLDFTGLVDANPEQHA
jgi:hypothetical protein